jgi:hypothetical protein
MSRMGRPDCRNLHHFPVRNGTTPVRNRDAPVRSSVDQREAPNHAADLRLPRCSPLTIGHDRCVDLDTAIVGLQKDHFPILLSGPVCPDPRQLRGLKLLRQRIAVRPVHELVDARVVGQPSYADLHERVEDPGPTRSRRGREIDDLNAPAAGSRDERRRSDGARRGLPASWITERVAGRLVSELHVRRLMPRAPSAGCRWTLARRRPSRRSLARPAGTLGVRLFAALIGACWRRRLLIVPVAAAARRDHGHGQHGNQQATKLYSGRI